MFFFFVKLNSEFICELNCNVFKFKEREKEPRVYTKEIIEQHGKSHIKINK